MVDEPMDNFSAIKITHEDEKVVREDWSRLYHAPSQNSDKKQHAFPLILLSYILGESSTSRLYQSLVVEKQIAVSAGSYYSDLQIGDSYFGFYATPSDGISFEKLESEIEEQIKEVQQNGVSKEELERAKKALIAETIYAREDLKTLAYLYGQVMASGLGMDYADEWEDNIKNVTAQQIQKAANYVLQVEKSVTGYLKPKG